MSWLIGMGMHNTKAPQLIEECRSVSQRVTQSIVIAEDNQWLLDIALDRLTLGRSAFYSAILRGGASTLPSIVENWAGDMQLCTAGLARDLDVTQRGLETAVKELRRSGHLSHLPSGLLTRAWLRFLTGTRTGSDSAQDDLDEAWEISERGPMRLFMADIHLYRARLFFREENYPKHWGSPAQDLAAARKLIETCGYGRRLEELQDAEAAILGKH